MKHPAQTLAVRLLSAALDQPKPTKELVLAVNKLLHTVNHPLARPEYAPEYAHAGR